MSNPKVSILMATWNRAGFIDAAIKSVLEQSFNDWELIIADDGSTDRTSAVVKSWQKKEPRIVCVRSEKNEGISKNYNKGLRVALGEYIAMIDDDDPWRDKEKLRKQIEFLDKNSDYVGCGGGVIVVDKNKKPARLASENVAGRPACHAGESVAGRPACHAGESVAGRPACHASQGEAGRELYRYFKPETDAEIRKFMLFSNPMANSTTMFRRSAGEKVGWYDGTTRYSGDRDFWLKMGTVGGLYNFREYFSYYTMGEENTSIAKLRPHLRASLMIMRRYKNKYPHYYPALLLNWIQYLYSFLPIFIRRPIHRSLARLKRLVAG